MVFDRVIGQQPAVTALTRALRSGRVHQAYRFEGPAGVGKELTAYAFAQSLLCERGGPIGCGQCRSCERVVSLSPEPPQVPRHPDLLLIARGLYPPALLGTSQPEVAGIGIEQVRRIVLARVGYPPHEGRAVVCVIRDADELTNQAANALLKTIEEPGERMFFVLVTSRPDRLPDTIRSRTLAVRFAPLADHVVASILERNGAPTEAAAVAEGSASLALQLADPEQMAARQDFADAVLRAVAARDLAAALDLLETRSLARDRLREQLAFLAQTFAQRGRQAVAAQPGLSELAARQHRIVFGAIRSLDRFGQPALVLEAMVARLRRA
ncbi:MAG: DNA polymerase III subunit [Polyangiaceae bacterium]|nr:DNA polymerase III subunit [Polyangiaceae bacterium]